MLSALLPGVREFRTPLVVGALWAACTWLLLGPSVAASDNTKELISRYNLGVLPSGAWLATAALGAYLFGSLLTVQRSPGAWIAGRFLPNPKDFEGYSYDNEVVLTRLLRRVIRWWTRNAQTWEPVDLWLTNQFEAMSADGRTPVMRSYAAGCEAPSGFEAFYDTKTVQFDDVEDPEQQMTIRHEMATAFVDQIKNEKPAVEVRIQMRFPEVYSEIDRLKVEAELRRSVFWPLILLGILLSLAWTPLALILVVVAPFILRDGYLRARQASDKTWSVLIAGEITAPVMDAMEAARGEDCRDFRRRFADTDA